MFWANDDPDKIYRSSKIWNLIASLMVACQSVVILIVITHTIGSVEAGIYTIGNTYANLFMTIGKYGMRDFHVSDVKREFSFRVYKNSRIITCSIMVVSFMVSVFVAAMNNGYSSHKTWILIFLCLYKLPDAFEDVFFGEYQRKGRLDIAAKALTIRMFATIGLFMLVVAVFKDLLLASAITCIVTFLIMIYLLIVTRKYVFTDGARAGMNDDNVIIQDKNTDLLNNEEEWKKALRLLIITAPLAIVSFLSIYVNASPRTAIDKYMSDTEQAIYGYISTPVFVVQTLITSIFNPKIYRISCIWNDKKIKELINEIIKLSLFIVGLTAVFMMGTFFVGIPILSLLYNMDLSIYKSDLMIMMAGSGLLSFVWLMTCMLIIMRRQKIILAVYVFVSAIAFICSDMVVKGNGIFGAVIFYLILLAILGSAFVVEFIIGVITEDKKQRKK